MMAQPLGTGRLIECPTDCSSFLIVGTDNVSKLNTENYEGKTALTMALERKDEAVVSMLKAHGAAD